MNSDSIVETTSNLVTEFYSKFLDLIPNLILAAIMFIIGLIIAWITRKLVRKFILYLDRNINKTLESKSFGVDLKSIAILLSKTFYWVIIILTIAAVTNVMGLPVLTTWFEGLVTYLPNILAGVLIVFIGIISGKLIGDLIATGSLRSGIANAVQLGNFVRYLLVTISLLIAVDQIGIDILFIIIILSIILGALLFGIALAFGLGARNSISNILSSYYLQKTYKEGDAIQVGEIEGVIIKINPTSVIVETKSGQIMIPAKDFDEKITVLIKKK